MVANCADRAREEDRCAGKHVAGSGEGVGGRSGRVAGGVCRSERGGGRRGWGCGRGEGAGEAEGEGGEKAKTASVTWGAWKWDESARKCGTVEKSPTACLEEIATIPSVFCSSRYSASGKNAIVNLTVK